jgi:hypothetical protein
VKLPIEEFGKQLILTGDLDPVYIAIYGANLPKPQLMKLLIAYWAFYHLGVAVFLSEQEPFWEACEVAARNTTPSPLMSRWPRSSERRHFRGEACVRAIQWLSKETVEARFEPLLKGTLAEVSEAIQAWPLFGNWISYKAADMLERCWGQKVEFGLDVCLLYDSPRKGLLMLAPENPERELDRLLKVFGKYKAPPIYDRACGVQEIETILCKFYSYTNGTYWIGKDIHEVRHGLVGWGDTAKRLLSKSPAEVKPIGKLF